jgi:hypothetical protein
MIVFSIFEVVGGRQNASSPFAVYHIDPSNGFAWKLTSRSPVKDGRLCFGNKRGVKAGDRLFKVFLDDSKNELPTLINPELFAPNKESGLILQSDYDISRPKRFVFYSRKVWDKNQHKDVLIDKVCLAHNLMMDSHITLQLPFPNKAPITLRFPVFIQPDADTKARYLFMREELESEGLYSFIYDELRGIFSMRRISLEWKEGSSDLSQEDSWVERAAIHEIWDWMFSKAIPALVRAPAYDVKDSIGLERISSIRHPVPSLFRKGRLTGNEFIVAKVRKQNFAIPAHIVIVSFLKRINSKLVKVCKRLDVEFNEAKDQEQNEKKQKFGKGVKGALRSIQGEMEDRQRIISEERTYLNRMSDDLRRLESTQVFKEAFSLPERCVFDVEPACFSFNAIYRSVRKRIIDFDSQYYNWHARANDSLLSAKPIDINSTQDPGESVYQWKYSMVYQFWCYYHFVRAAKSIGLHPVQVSQFNSHDGSWISFETNDEAPPVRLSLFHEVKGYAQRNLWKEAKTALQSDEWCVGGTHDDDPILSGENKVKYLEPDFVLKIEGFGKTAFLVVLDAKADPNWSNIHGDAQRKYRSFCQYLKGYLHTSIEDPAYLVKTIQSWIIFPERNHSMPSVCVKGAWSLNTNHLAFTDPWKLVYSPSTGKAFPDIDTSKVCLGRLSADPSIGVKNRAGVNHPLIDYRKPFENFLRMQIDYFRTEHPKTLTSLP